MTDSPTPSDVAEETKTSEPQAVDPEPAEAEVPVGIENQEFAFESESEPKSGTVASHFRKMRRDAFRKMLSKKK